MPSRNKRCFIGIDLGTSGCRGVSIDEQGKVLTAADCPLPASTIPQVGWVEQIPEDWWKATVKVIRALLTATQKHEALSIAIDGTSSTLLLTDDNGQALSPGLMYNDRRATQESRSLRTVASTDSVVHSPSSSLSKLLWLVRHRPPAEAGLHALHQSEWISGRLCGRFDLGDENNCLKLGYDPIYQCWPDWMKQLNLPSGLLPTVVAPGTVLARISHASAGETGLPQSCRVIAGTTDSTAAALASGVALPGDAVTSLGSTLVCKILSEQPQFNQEYGIYSHRILGHWLVGGASNVGGSVLRRNFSDEALATLSRQIDPRRSLCLNYYPLPDKGERFPFNDPDMQPRLTPVPRDRRRFLQGILEGIARVERTAYGRLGELGAPQLRRVYSSGGGASNSTWMSMRQRILKTPVLPSRHPQAAWGAASIALRASY